MVRTIVEKEIANYEWIDISEPTPEDFDFIKARYNLNEASIKDSKEPEHLPKIEEFENYTFIILRVMSDNFKENSDSIGEVTDRLTVFYGNDFVITVHKRRIEFLEKLKNIEFTSIKLKIAANLPYLSRRRPFSPLVKRWNSSRPASILTRS